MLHSVNDIWCMERCAYSRLEELLAAWDGKIPEARESSQPRRQKQVAVMSLSGFMEPKMSIMGMLFGGTSTDSFGAVFDQVIRDDRIGGVVIDVDSPGGSVFGTPELGDRIFAARGSKPIISVANPYAASAALWVASAADRVVVTPSGQAGSVGAYWAHLDTSAAMEQKGVRKEFIVSKASPYKVETESHAPLSDEARANAQERVDEWGNLFVSSLAKYRGLSPEDVRSHFGKGRMLTAKKAVQAGMADRIATLDDTIAQLAAGRVRLGSRAADDQWDHRRIGLTKRRAVMAGLDTSGDGGLYSR